MTVLALRMCGWRNGVSHLHGRVTRRMWQVVWPDLPEDKIPITSVTNGVHAPTWIAQELSLLFDRYLGPEWVDRHDDISFWNRVMEIPDEEIWNVHQFLKRKFLTFARERARERWSKTGSIRGRSLPWERCWIRMPLPSDLHADLPVTSEPR